MGTCPNIDVVRAFVFRKWVLKGQVEVAALPGGCLSLSFSYMKNLRNILCNGWWVIGKHPMFLHKWCPNLNMQDDLTVQAPVWVKLLGLPLEFQMEDMFKGIENVFGELLSMDPIIVSRRCLTYAKICVRIHQGVDMLDSITLHSKLGSWVQKIEYESIPFAYFSTKNLVIGINNAQNEHLNLRI